MMGRGHELGDGRISEDGVVRETDVGDGKIDELGVVVLTLAKGDWEVYLPPGGWWSRRSP